MNARPLPEDWTLPAVTPLNDAWFTSGELRIQVCADCAARQHPPEEVCHQCGGVDFDHDVVEPRGSVHSFTIVHHPAHPALADHVPYAVVLIALDADPTIRVVGNLVSTPTDQVRIGMPVEAVWQELSDEEGTVLLPQWAVGADPASG